ncbi:heme/hemin ABC transporter substrate-binding protein [Microvirga flavescens]|uniref:heme/hemin ABC transporter substrate-binding protein n=1 Tax=Microvirga flavescens TaxID=2249811 RepID=UPI000DD5B7C7|nr:ABC transporter substrate-binding protein [Microvirga flavescens]
MTRLSRREMMLASLLPLAFPAHASASRRIVSIGGAVTEILYRLGAEPEIVGVDSTSQFPVDALGKKANVGYMRTLGAEGILSLSPTLVLASEAAGPPDALRLIEQAGVTVVRITDEPSQVGIVRRIRDIAQAIGAQDRGAALVEDVERGFSRLGQAHSKIASGVRALFVLSIQNGRPLVGGRGTTADAMLALAGATNVASSLEGWKPLSDEGLIAAAPEVIVMVSHGPGGAAADPFALPSFAATPAAAKRRLVVMDTLYLLGFGPRTPNAAGDLMLALYPDLADEAKKALRP